jgi:glycosyltransferase involved in cell wall biosynthesis
MKVLVLTPGLYDSAPGPRFRIEQWSRLLETQGYEFRFLPFEDRALHDCLYSPGQVLEKCRLMLSAVLRRLASSAALPKCDVVFLYREAAALGPAICERLIALRRVPVVYDFDDPIWIRYRSPVNRWFTLLRAQAKTASICRLSTSVIVGNRLLAQYASLYSKIVNVVPSTIDMRNYPLRAPRSTSTVITLGWTGSHSTLPFLEKVLACLRRVAEQRRFRLVVISHTDSYRIPNPGFEVVSRRWNAATEAEDLSDIDIGLAPFPNSGWTPWRCHGKVLQYMAAAIPCVASSIGVIPDYIQDGVAGYLVQREEDWPDRIVRLIDDESLRVRMGENGRQIVQASYSAEVWAPQVATILEAAVSGARA